MCSEKAREKEKVREREKESVENNGERIIVLNSIILKPNVFKN